MQESFQMRRSTPRNHFRLDSDRAGAQVRDSGGDEGASQTRSLMLEISMFAPVGPGRLLARSHDCPDHVAVAGLKLCVTHRL